MQLTEEWTPSPMHEIGASFLHATPPPFLYKQPASPSLHTLGYHTGRLPLRSPSDSTLSACLVCVEALESLILSPLFFALRCKSSAEIDAHNINKEETARKLWRIFDSTLLHLLLRRESLTGSSTSPSLLQLQCGSSAENFLSTHNSSSTLYVATLSTPFY